MKTLIIRSSVIALLVGIGALCGCATEEEMQARRDFAFDLSGDYEEVRPDGVEAGTLEIINENDKHDIRLVFTRGDLYDGEVTFVDRLRDDVNRQQVQGELVLGAGHDPFAQAILGGENVSLNHGKTSRVLVHSPLYPANPAQEGATESKVQYWVDVTIENGTDKLHGKFNVAFTEERPDPADPNETEVHRESAQFNIEFRRLAGPIESDRL